VLQFVESKIGDVQAAVNTQALKMAREILDKIVCCPSLILLCLAEKGVVIRIVILWETIVLMIAVGIVDIVKRGEYDVEEIRAGLF
jgi:hypothetical protein